MTRTPLSQDFDPRIADWLEDDTDRAPALVLDTVLAAFPSIPQRRAARVPWRFQTMYRYALLGAAVVAIVAIGVGGFALGSGPTSPPASVAPSPSPSPSQAAWPSYAKPYSFDLSTRASSPLYGYSIAMDPAWTFTAATVAADDQTATDETGADHLAITGSDTTIAVTRTALTGGETFDTYLAEARQGALGDSSVPDTCKSPDPSQWDVVPVGDQQGHVMALCNNEVVYVDLAGQVYAFEWGHGTFDAGQHLEESDFRQLLRSVDLGTGHASPSP
jgi:hypothetical protein